MKDYHGELYRFRLPLREPLTLAHGVLEWREGLLLRIIDDEGYESWGEASPLPGFSVESLADAEASLRRVLNSDLHLHELKDNSWEPSVAFALESASAASFFSSVTLVESGLDAFFHLPEFLSVQALLVGSEDNIVRRATWLRKNIEGGCATAKLKVGQFPVEEDVKRVRAICAALGEKFTLRLDANRAWKLPEALSFAKGVDGLPLEYVEEPLRDPLQLPAFTGLTGMAYALDESLRGPKPLPQEVMRAATAYVVKPSLQIFEPPEANSKVPLIFSGAFESGVGTAALLREARSRNLGTIPLGLDTYSCLADDVLEAPLPLAPGLVNFADVAAAARRVDMSKLERIA